MSSDIFHVSPQWWSPSHQLFQFLIGLLATAVAIRSLAKCPGTKRSNHASGWIEDDRRIMHGASWSNFWLNFAARNEATAKAQRPLLDETDSLDQPVLHQLAQLGLDCLCCQQPGSGPRLDPACIRNMRSFNEWINTKIHCWAEHRRCSVLIFSLFDSLC